jgi:hypothetical protein
VPWQQALSDIHDQIFMQAVRANLSANAWKSLNRIGPYVRASEGPVAMAVTPMINAP